MSAALVLGLLALVPATSRAAASDEATSYEAASYEATSDEAGGSPVPFDDGAAPANPLDPSSSIDGAARYLSSLTKQFGSTELALAAYNAGPGTVSRYGGVPPFAQTPKKVRAGLSKAEAYR